VDNPAEDIQQPYDTLIKAFFRSEMGTLIPYVLKGATLDGTLEEAEQNVEIDRSILKGRLSLLDQVSPAASHFTYRTAEWPR